MLKIERNIKYFTGGTRGGQRVGENNRREEEGFSEVTEVACEQTDEEQNGQLPMYGSSYLKGYSTAALIQRSWVQILLKSQNFFRIYLQFLKLQLPM